MKRRIVWILMIAIVLSAALCREAICPDRFTGIWYAEGSGEAYHFRDGIIRGSRDTFRGAYGFARDTVTLFVADPEGDSEIQTLRWIREGDGDILCSDRKEIVFCRSREKAMK